MNSTGARTVVSFVFYTGMGSAEPFLNRATAVLSGGPYMHVEIVFTNPDGSNVSCGVWQGQTVFFKAKTFGKDCWVWRSLTLKPLEVRTLRNFCREQAAADLPFNRAGLWRCMTPFPRPTDGTQWFCSELCVAALQKIGYLTDQIPSSITPTRLFELVGQMKGYANASSLMNTRIEKKSLKFGYLAHKKKAGGGHSARRSRMFPRLKG